MICRVTLQPSGVLKIKKKQKEIREGERKHLKRTGQDSSEYKSDFKKPW